MKALCYSPYNMWKLHGLWEITILHALRLKGADIRYVLCDALYSECDLYWKATNPRHPMSCNACQAEVANLMNQMRMPYEWLGRYLHPEDFGQAKLWADSININNFIEARYNDWEIGQWVESSVHSHFRMSELDLDDPEIQATYRNYLYSGLIASLGLNRLLDSYAPDVLFLFNGRMFSTRIALELSRKRGIRVVTHERGLYKESLTIIENANCLDLKTFKKMWEDWGSMPLNKDELDIVDKYLNDRAYGKNHNWKSFSPSPQPLEWISGQLKTSKNRTVWCLFTSSDDEVICEGDWKSVFPRQYEWIRKTIDYVDRHPAIDLVIRVHPNTSGKKATGTNRMQLKEFEELQKNLPKNVRIVMPDDPISSYSLMELATVGLIYQSTVGLEMACLGKTVISAAGSLMSGLPFVKTVASVKIYESLLDELLTIPPLTTSLEIKRLAYRYAYGYFFRVVIPFPLVKMPDPHNGELAYSQMEDLMPGKEPNLDRIVRILNGEPVCLPPTAEENKRTEEIETDWFKNTDKESCYQKQSDKSHKNSAPLVSVIIPCYNYGRYLKEAVESVIAQTFQNLEIIIVNDGSTDNSKEVAENLLAAYPDHKIRLINQENSGQPAISRNTGISKAKGKYILCLDADDKIAPDMIKDCFDLLEVDLSVGIVYTDRQDFDGIDQIIRAEDYNFSKLIYANQISYCALYRREIWEKIGGYRTNVKGLEDWDFWIAAGSKGYFARRILKPLFHYRRHDTGLYQEALRDFNKKFAQIILNNREVYRDEDIEKARILLGEYYDQSPEDAPMVSVIVPTHNRPEMLVETLKSILNQTYKNFEIIVVNDAGSDVADVIKSLDHSDKIVYIKHHMNKGLAAARNTGIMAAGGKYIAYLDDDDIFYPEHIETLVNFLEANKGYKAAYTDAYRAHQERKDGRYVVTKKDTPHSSDFDYNLILRGNFIPVLCVMHEKSCLDEVGLFDETLKAHEDWDLWMRMSRKFQFAHIKKITCEYSWREDASSMTSGKREDMLSTWRIVSERGNRYISDQEGQANSAYQDIQRLITAGRHDEALVELEKLVNTFPGYALAHNDLGVLYFNRGDRERALNHYEKAAQLNPENITFQKNLADFYFVVSERLDDALKIYLKILDKHPDDIETLLALGQICTSLNRIEDAIFLLGRALEIEPDNINARQCLDVLQPKPVDITKRVSIIIPVFNKVEFTKKCLEAIVKNTPREMYDLIIVDNASTDGTKEFLKSLNGDLKIITNEKNLGFARACNQGARAASTDYILFLNNDTEPQPGWLLPLVNIIEKDKDAGIVAPKLVYPNGTIQHCGKVWKSVTGPESHPEHLYLCMPKDAPCVNKSREFQMVTGACILLRRNEFLDLGLFDEEYLNGWEDDDLCYRFRNSGKKVFYCAESEVVHHENATLKESFTKETFKKNRERFFSKWSTKVKRDDLKYLIEDGFVLSRENNELKWVYKGIPGSQAKSVLIGNLVRGGDVFLTTTLLPELRKRHPDSEITFACAPAFIEILEGNPYIDKILPFGSNSYSEADWSKLVSLASDYEASYLAQPIPDFGKEFFSTLRDGNWHLTDILSAKTGIYHYHRKPEIYLNNDEIKNGLGILEDKGVDIGKPYIVFHITAQDDCKTWSPDKLKELVKSLKGTDEKLQFVLVGGEEAKTIKIPGLVNLSGKTTIRQTAAIIMNAAYFIGVDSLPAHLTSLRNTPGIVLFGSTFPEFCGPINSNIHSIARPVANQITPEEVAEIFKRNMLNGSASDTFDAGKTSIVILTYNQLSFTKECVESIRKHTPEPHEIIFVDNGSKDGTVKWLKKLVKDNANYKLIENKENLGFAKGCNQGITAASGEYILLLNNDVVVTEGWLSGMAECLNSSPDIGIVGPMTNNISGLQKVLNVNYASIEHLDGFAGSFRDRNRHRRILSRRVVGFCMLFRRALAGKVGLLDETFGSGNFEDDDYCLRVALEGYRNIIAGDVFIHHYGSQSFIGNKIDYSSAIVGNKKIFDRKWSVKQREDSVAQKLLVINTLEKGDELYQKGHLDEAVELILQKGIKYAPNDNHLYYAIAEMLIDAKLFKDALDTINEMPLDESDSRRLELTGYCKQGMGFDDEADGFADRALALNPLSFFALNLKGIIAYKKGNNTEAEAFFNRAIASAPSFGEPYAYLGAIRWATGEKEEGLALLERGAILSPTVTDIVNLYHSAISEMGAFERGELVFEDAVALHPQNKNLNFLLIDLLIQQGKHAKAMDRIEEAMIVFGIDDGMLSAACEIRKQLEAEERSNIHDNKNTVSLCMIVKNEEKNLAKCLKSLKPVVDEMIVVDTGSTDRTGEIAKAFGSKVYDFPWTGSFSDARNFSISKASGKWIFVMDADEVISPLDYPVFNELVKKTKVASAFKFVTRNYITSVNIDTWNPNDGSYHLEEAGAGWFPSIKVRLFPNNSEIRFENPVHEMVEPSLKKLKMPVKEVAIPVHHYGKLSVEKSREKGEQYYLLGRKKLEETGGNLDAICELAIQAGELERYDEALELWQKAINIAPNLPVAFMNMGHIYLQKKEFKKSIEASRTAMELKPDYLEAISNYAIGELCGGDIKSSISVLEGLLNKNRDYLLALGVLSASYCCNGQREKGLECFARLNQEQVAFSGLLSSLAKQLIAAGRVGYATLLLEAAVESSNINADIPGLLTECYNTAVV